MSCNCTSLLQASLISCAPGIHRFINQIDNKDNCGATAFFYIMDLKYVNILFEHGTGDINVNEKDYRGRTPFEYAIAIYLQSVGSSFGKCCLDKMMFLLECGADINHIVVTDPDIRNVIESYQCGFIKEPNVE